MCAIVYDRQLCDISKLLKTYIAANVMLHLHSGEIAKLFDNLRYQWRNFLSQQSVKYAFDHNMLNYRPGAGTSDATAATSRGTTTP